MIILFVCADLHVILKHLLVLYFYRNSQSDTGSYSLANSSIVLRSHSNIFQDRHVHDQFFIYLALEGMYLIYTCLRDKPANKANA